MWTVAHRALDVRDLGSELAIVSSAVVGAFFGFPDTFRNAVFEVPSVR